MNLYQKYPAAVLILTYEDLKKDAFKEVSRLLDFMEIRINPHNLRQAIEFSSFSNMQNMEKAGQFADPRLIPGDKDNVNSFKVRKGKVGNYKEELNEADVEHVNQNIAKNLCPEMRKILGI